MELNQLRGFYALARERSFSKAASRLSLTQPAISLQIKALEAELGESLFERHRKAVRLTTAGEVLYQHVQSVLASLEEAKSEIAGLQQLLRGHVAVGTSDTICTYILPEMIRKFRSQYPAVRVDIRNNKSSRILQMVLDNEVDFGLATLPLAHPQVSTDVVYCCRDILICPWDHPLSRKRIVSLAQISAYPLLVFPAGSTTRGLLEAAFRQADLPMQVAMNLSSVESIKRFVEIDLGVSIVPHVAVTEEERAGRLAALPIRGLPPREIGLIERKSKRRSAAATAFLQLLRDHAERTDSST
jgi:DNA-binding transcriptional LysR family regulator